MAGPTGRARRRVRLALTILVISVGFAGTAQPAPAQTTPPGLTGESFDAFQGFRNEPGPVGQLQVSSECTPTGNATITYTASGPAVGPYPGTFTETGTATLGPEGTGPLSQGLESRALLSFSASFTVQSGPDQVSGTKSADPQDIQPAIHFGYCFDIPGDPPGRHAAFQSPASYEATITTSSGGFRDSGTAPVVVHRSDRPGAESVFNFSEVFTSAGPVVPIAVPLDHFKSYEIDDDEPEFQSRTVTLEDQFGRSEVVVRAPRELLNPVDKNGEGVHTPDAHLKCYEINDRTEFPEREVAVENQFGSQTLEVRRPRRLCLPASKGAPGQDPGEPPTGIDHFKCYGVDRDDDDDDDDEEGRSGDQPQVTLEDQFGRDEVVVEEPRYLCNPTDKNGEGIERPDDHMVCYELGDLDRFRERDVSLRDQFATQTVEVERPKSLCVPSQKQP